MRHCADRRRRTSQVAHVAHRERVPTERRRESLGRPRASRRAVALTHKPVRGAKILHGDALACVGLEEGLQQQLRLERDAPPRARTEVDGSGAHHTVVERQRVREARVHDDPHRPRVGSGGPLRPVHHLGRGIAWGACRGKGGAPSAA